MKTLIFIAALLCCSLTLAKEDLSSDLTSYFAEDPEDDLLSLIDEVLATSDDLSLSETNSNLHRPSVKATAASAESLDAKKTFSLIQSDLKSDILIPGTIHSKYRNKATEIVLEAKKLIQKNSK